MFINYATGEIILKIVYYGSGLSGKTTNLKHIHAHTPEGARSKLLSLATQADRTLFFDLLPLELGSLAGMRIRLQLYTVPGQVFYNSTRQMVLKGADGVVFIVDSQRPLLQSGLESLQNLRENLKGIGVEPQSIPVVFQYNKRDLTNILPLPELQEAFNPDGAPSYLASAEKGQGVLETLKEITRQVLKRLPLEVEEPGGRAASASVAPAPPPNAPVPGAVPASPWSHGEEIEQSDPLGLADEFEPAGSGSDIERAEDVPDTDLLAHGTDFLGVGPEEEPLDALMGGLPDEEPTLAREGAGAGSPGDGEPDAIADFSSSDLDFDTEGSFEEPVPAEGTLEEAEEEEDEESDLDRAGRQALSGLFTDLEESPPEAGFETVAVGTSPLAAPEHGESAEPSTGAAGEEAPQGDSPPPIAVEEDVEPSEGGAGALDDESVPPVLLEPLADESIALEEETSDETDGEIAAELLAEKPMWELAEEEEAASPAEAPVAAPTLEESEHFVPLAPDTDAEMVVAEVETAGVEPGTADVEEESEIPSIPAELERTPEASAAVEEPVGAAESPIEGKQTLEIPRSTAVPEEEDAKVTVRLPEAPPAREPYEVPAGQLLLTCEGPIYRDSRFAMSALVASPELPASELAVALLADPERMTLVGAPLEKVDAKSRAQFPLIASTEGWHRMQALLLSERRFLARAGCELFVFPKHHIGQPYVTYAEPAPVSIDLRYPLHSHDLVVALMSDRVGDDYRLSYAIYQRAEDLVTIPRPLTLQASVASACRRALASVAAAEGPRREAVLATAGLALWNALLPLELGQLLASERETIDSVLVASEDTWIPWEILRPSLDALPLGVRLRVAQWPGLVTPRGSLGTGEALAVLGSEREDVPALCGDATACHSRETVFFSMTGRPYDLIYMRGEGFLDPDLPAFTTLGLEDGRIQAADLAQFEAEFREGRPFILLDLLASEDEELSDSGAAAWAASLVGRLWGGGLVAPRIPLLSESSRAAWGQLERLIVSGTTVGHALRELRRLAFTEPEADKALLAFALYGDPDARLETPRP